MTEEKKSWTRTSAFGLVLALSLAMTIGLGAPSTASAQGCALCYQSAASAGPRAIHALRNGIVILMVPPVFICSAIAFLVYRRRNLHDHGT
jgi:hypothetical protein